MPAAVRSLESIAGLAIPALLLAGLVAVIAGESVSWTLPSFTASDVGPPVVTIAPRAYAYREPGDFISDGRTVDGPLISVRSPAPLDIMVYQVSAADYQRCVDDGVCRAAAPRRKGVGDIPVTGVSFEDATDYATWLSRRTGETWRLPTVAEWVFAAGERAVDPGLGSEATDDPIERWIALYEREAELGAGALASPEALGTFGMNALGVADIGGSVWEWTSSCESRTTLGPDGSTLTHLPSCGVRYVEGRHRAAVSFFVRDARAGGCSTGTPPDNLGFRLVRERGWLERMLSP